MKLLTTTSRGVDAGRSLVGDGRRGRQPGASISRLVNGDVVQKASTADLVIDAAALVAYVSTFITFVPRDVFSIGTLGGVEHVREPPRYLTPVQLETRIAGVGGAAQYRHRSRLTWRMHDGASRSRGGFAKVFQKSSGLARCSMPQRSRQARSTVGARR
ncbi:fumarylacetoacetate hydrolase family protein [Kribbella sp. DT2]|uniref:fumarylacetoacetate hydrolase family protein n=1 Tax=Kribbella sp. DT2 TaxID=3393427 RepID=UPI003CE9D296